MRHLTNKKQIDMMKPAGALLYEVRPFRCDPSVRLRSGWNPNLLLGRGVRARLRIALFGVVLAILSCPLGSGVLKAAEPLRLTLPPEVYAVAGHESRIYFDNIVLTETSDAFRFEVTGQAGKPESRFWSFIPVESDVGERKLTVTVSDSTGKELERAESLLRVVRADSGRDRELKVLIVGDSLTHASAWPNELARRLAGPGNPRTRLVGTHRPASAAEGVAHEGYGGWTWARFATQFEPMPDGTYSKRSSPFVFVGADQKPVLDIGRYSSESLKGDVPDVVVFLLGINDCFGANPDSLEATDERINAMFKEADTLLTAFRKAFPQADLAVCTTPAANARESGFEANYKGKYHRWGWKRIQHRLVERQIEKFKGREAERVFLVPTELHIDPVDGYPVDNGVHPNGIGYRQIGESVYAWLKWRMRSR